MRTLLHGVNLFNFPGRREIVDNLKCILFPQLLQTGYMKQVVKCVEIKAVGGKTSQFRTQ
jgi:hypothetical protein